MRVSSSGFSMMPSSRSTSGWTTIGCLHFSHRRRTSRWAMMDSTELDTRNGSMPMSTKRLMELAASLVCSVLRTK